MRALIALFCLTMTYSAFGADSLKAVIYGNGTVYLDGAQLSASAPVVAGDVVQTKEAGVALLSTVGSSVSVQSNSIVRLESQGIALDRGTISMATGKSLSVFTRDFKITPVSTSWTQFDVIRSGGEIQIFARKNDVTVSCGVKEPVLVKEGQRISRVDADNCGIAVGSTGTPVAAKGPILASPTAQRVGLAVATGVAAWGIFQADDPVSPSVP